jgi:hypothetical protein
VIVAADPDEPGTGGDAHRLIKGSRWLRGHDDLARRAGGLLVDHGWGRRPDRDDAAGGPGENGGHPCGADEGKACELPKCVEIHGM